MTHPDDIETANYIQRLPGGICYAHGPFSEGDYCPKWPRCISDPQQPEFLACKIKRVDPSAPASGPFKADEYPRKPANCKCGFPLVLCRNMCGHDDECPCYAEWAMKTFLNKEHRKGDAGCEGCDNPFGGARFPAEHRFEIPRHLEVNLATIGAVPIHCWLNNDGRVHCQVTRDIVTYVCDGCGWYQQEALEVQPAKQNITLKEIRVGLEYRDPNPHQEIAGLRKVIDQLLAYLEKQDASW